jgi:hypothetical protein
LIIFFIIIEDPWLPVDEFIEAFNKNNINYVCLGTYVTIDESISENQTNSHTAEAPPHTVKIMRKPRGIGIEIYAMCCGSSKIMTCIELNKGKEFNLNNNLEYNNSNVQFHSALVLRLSKHLQGTWRIIIGDSAFGSIATIKCLLEKGLHGIFMVKQCSSKYPKKFFKAWEVQAPRGSWKVLETDVNVNGTAEKVFALAWKTKMAKTIVASCGNTLPGNPQFVPRSKKVIVDGIFQTARQIKQTAQPTVIENMFKSFSAIDIHNHLRQNLLAIEIYCQTTSWYNKLFSTLLGMIVTNAYYAYQLEFNGEPNDICNYQEFCSKLAYQLIFNKAIAEEARATRKRREDGENDSDIEEVK